MRCATLSLTRVSSSTYDAGRTARQRMKESPKKNQPFHFTVEVPPTAPFTLQLPFTAADLRWTSAQVWKAQRTTLPPASPVTMAAPSAFIAVDFWR